MRQIIACFTATALFVSGAELPIREVVLYKHGIGYFERSGDIPAGETARLSFKAAEMNDVLKSLTVQGGKVNSLRYDASDPLAHRLAEFPFKFDAENPTLAGFLAQLRGARAVLQFGSERGH